MKTCAKQEKPNAAACACHEAAQKVRAAASRPYVRRAGLALFAEASIAVGFVLWRRRLAHKRRHGLPRLRLGSR